MSAITTMILSGVVAAIVSLIVSSGAMVIYLEEEKKTIDRILKIASDTINEMKNFAISKLENSYKEGWKDCEMASKGTGPDSKQ